MNKVNGNYIRILFNITRSNFDIVHYLKWSESRVLTLMEMDVRRKFTEVLVIFTRLTTKYNCQVLS